MSTNFWFVRHGPTRATGAIGWTDLDADLSDAARLSALSTALPKDAVILSSDLTRASKTADAIADGRQRLSHDARFREIHFGAWEGRDFEEIGAKEPELLQAYWDTPGDVSPPGGESWNDLTTRVSNGLMDMTGSTHKNIICVAHFGVILAAISFARAISAGAIMGFKIDPLSVTHLEHLPKSDAWRIHRVNHIP